MPFLLDVERVQAIIQPYAEAGTLLPRTIPELSENVRDFIVAEDEGCIVGCGALHLYGRHLAEIRSIAVLPQEKGRGIGRRLVEALMEEWRRHGVSCVCLFTRRRKFSRISDSQPSSGSSCRTRFTRIACIVPSSPIAMRLPWPSVRFRRTQTVCATRMWRSRLSRLLSCQKCRAEGRGSTLKP